MGNDRIARIVGLIQSNVCLFFIRHWHPEIQNKRKLQKNMRQNTKYYITKYTAGRSHPATTPSRMAGTRPPKLTNQDSPLSLTIGASLFPMVVQRTNAEAVLYIRLPMFNVTVHVSFQLTFLHPFYSAGDVYSTTYIWSNGF